MKGRGGGEVRVLEAGIAQWLEFPPTWPSLNPVVLTRRFAVIVRF